MHPLPAAGGDAAQSVVFGAGNADADLMFLGEAPGQREDEQGLPFVGQAGQLLVAAAGGDRAAARGRLHLQHAVLPPAGQPRPAAAGDLQLPGLHLPPAGADPAARWSARSGNFATKLLRGDPTGITRLHGRPEVRDDRPAHGPAAAALPPGRGALHALAAGHAARGLRADPAPAGARLPEQPRLPSPSREPVREPEPDPPPGRRRTSPSSGCSSARRRARSRHSSTVIA